MFIGCSSLLIIPDISKWNTENLIEMNQIFYGCSSLLIHPDFSKWNINKNTNKYFSFSSLSNIDITSSNSYNSYSDNADSLIINSISSINYKSVELETNIILNSIFDSNFYYKEELNDYYEEFFKLN